MKKFYAYFMALVCAVFVGVSCTPDSPAEPEGEPKVPVLTVTGAPEANLAVEGGEFTVNYAVENATDAPIEVSTEAAWLHVGDITADAVPFTYDANTDAPGSEAREAVITFAYAGAEAVVVTVKQDAYASHFNITYANVTTTSASATITPIEGVGTYLWKNVDGATLESYKDSENPAQAYLDNYLAGTGKWFATLSEGVLADQSISSYSGSANIVIVGAYKDENGNFVYTTPVYCFQVPLLPKPVLTITPLAHTVSNEAGSLTLDYTVENPIEGVKPVLSAEAGWTNTTIEEGKITIAYDANDLAKSRTASLSFSYEGADAAQVVTIEQAANPNAEAITFTLDVTETHFDHAIVNVTPSNTNVKYVLAAVSKSDFEGWRYEGSDAKLQEDLASSYYKPSTILTGAQTGYKLSVGASKAEDWYIYAYAVSDDEKTATSDVAKTLVTINFDKPTLAFDVAPFEVSAEGGTYTMKYTLTNPVEGGVVKFNGMPSNYYGVLNEESMTIDTEKCEVTFQVNPYDAEQYSHYAYIYIAYYPDATSTKSIVTASVKINQLAPAN